MEEKQQMVGLGAAVGQCQPKQTLSQLFTEKGLEAVVDRITREQLAAHRASTELWQKVIDDLRKDLRTQSADSYAMQKQSAQRDAEIAQLRAMNNQLSKRLAELSLGSWFEFPVGSTITVDSGTCAIRRLENELAFAKRELEIAETELKGSQQVASNALAKLKASKAWAEMIERKGAVWSQFILNNHPVGTLSRISENNRNFIENGGPYIG